MKTQRQSIFKRFVIYSLSLFTIGLFSSQTQASNKDFYLQDTLTFIQYKGSIIDSKSKTKLSFASLALLGTNIAGVSNSEGEFSIKVPKDHLNASLMVSFIGYKNKIISLNELNQGNNLIELDPFNIALSEIVISTNEAEALFRQVMERREKNYSTDQDQMTGFYRETVRKRRAYLSLSESIIEIQKQPYQSELDDYIELFKGRKNADYNKLDTLTFKLQGGPYSTIFLDIMKYPDIIFTNDALANFEFSLENNTQIDEKKVYVLAFRQKPQIIDPLYYGKLFIDTESLAVIKATFNLNVQNKKAVSTLFTQKKPSGSEVYPIEASYQINYREQHGKWRFAYSRGDITFKVDWAKKLFNSTYESTIELAVTDWEKKSNESAKPGGRLRQNVIMIDKVSNFADPDFWGEYNIIEPEKSIESAIRKIQRKMKD